MNKISESSKHALFFERFKGMDVRTGQKDELGSSLISNFRITTDGSLKKRYGYRPLFEFPSPIRAIWTGKLNGIIKGYALVGSKVLLLNLDEQSYTEIGTVSTSSGKGEFFYYRTKLYLIDGGEIYVVTDQGILKPFGYVPLIGKDWNETYFGEPYESKNLLNGHARISYVIKASSGAYLRTADPIISIDAVYINGVKVPDDRYTVPTIPRTVIFNDMTPGDRVVICYQYERNADLVKKLLSCKNAVLFGGINNTRPFIWGGEDSSVMYNAAYVYSKDQAEAQTYYDKSDDLYFPEGHEFTVGDGRYPITAVSKHYDRLLIFTEKEAWMADSGACGIEEFPIMRINSSTGVTAPCASALVDNEPCTVGARSIFRWTSNTEELDECNAYSISDAINDILPKDFYTNAFVFYDSANNEILFGSPSLEDRILVYNTKSKAWTVFDGINAEGFVDCISDVGFISGSKLFVFDKTCSYDRVESDKDIRAVFESNTIDLDTTRHKHLSSLVTSYKGKNVIVDIFLDGSTAPVCSVALDDLGDFGTVRQRLSARRFKQAKLSLRAGGSSMQTICSLCLYTRQDK